MNKIHLIIRYFFLCLSSILKNIPDRIIRIAEHIYHVLLGLKNYFFKIRQQPSRFFQTTAWSSSIWIGRLLTKILDLAGLAEIWSFLWQLFHPNTRPLTELERTEAHLVYKDSLPYDMVRIVENSWVARLGASRVGSVQMGMGLGYTIHFTRPIRPKAGNGEMKWLIHELAHVAQTQYVGIQYMPEALYAQYTTGYDYGGPKGLRGKSYSDLNREQQGCIPEDFYAYVLYHREHRVYGEMPYGVYEPLIEELRRGEM